MCFGCCLDDVKEKFDYGNKYKWWVFWVSVFGSFGCGSGRILVSWVFGFGSWGGGFGMSGFLGKGRGFFWVRGFVLVGWVLCFCFRDVLGFCFVLF